MKNRHQWNYNLTKETDSRVARIAESLKGKKSWAKGLKAETDTRIAKIKEKRNKTIRERGYVFKVTNEIRQNWSKQRKGRKQTPEWIEKRRVSVKDNARTILVLCKYGCGQQHTVAGRIRHLKDFHPEQFEKQQEHATHYYVKHNDHFHRSKAEAKYCVNLQALYDAGLLHANVRYKNVEVDWVLGSNRKDPATWQKVIEYHKVRKWEGETAESYKQKRTEKYLAVGIVCPVEFVLF